MTQELFINLPKDQEARAPIAVVVKEASKLHGIYWTQHMPSAGLMQILYC